MGFNVDKFLATNFEPRTEEIELPDMRDFFEGEKPVWKVRGLNGVELARAREESEKNKTIKQVLEGILSNSSKEKAEAIKEALGVTNNIPQDIAYRTAIFITGSKDYQERVDYQLANAMCKAYPIEYLQITNKIIQLTGLGHIPGKVSASGMTTQFKQD